MPPNQCLRRPFHITAFQRAGSPSVPNRKYLCNLRSVALEELVAHFCGALERLGFVMIARRRRSCGDCCHCQFTSRRCGGDRWLGVYNKLAVWEHATQHMIESTGCLVSIAFKPFDSKCSDSSREAKHLGADIGTPHGESFAILLFTVYHDLIHFLQKIELRFNNRKSEIDTLLTNTLEFLIE